MTNELLICLPGNLEADNNTLANFEFVNARTSLLDDSHKLKDIVCKYISRVFTPRDTNLVTKDVALLQRHNLPMIEVEVRATDSGTGDFEDDIVILRDVGYRRVD